MIRNWKRLGLMPVLAVALFATGCSDQTSPVGPQEPLAVQGLSESLSLRDDLAAIVRGAVPDLSARTNEAVIGPNGGFVYVSLHYLYVPKGAVSQPTLFRMELPADGSIGASLTATRVGSAIENDVGSAGFRRPVYLTFSYAYATDLPANPKRLKIVWVKDDGTMEAQPTAVNPFFKSATGVLDHFSDYALVMP